MPQLVFPLIIDQTAKLFYQRFGTKLEPMIDQTAKSYYKGFATKLELMIDQKAKLYYKGFATIKLETMIN